MATYGGGNALLDRLSDKQAKGVIRRLEIVELGADRVLAPGRGERGVEDVFFPIRAVTSMLTLPRNGDGVEAATVGHEGFAPYQAMFGAEPILERWVCTVPGTAARISAPDLRELMDASSALRAVLLQYAQWSTTALAQSVACNLKHHVLGRCAKWLLVMQDALQSEEFCATHEFVSAMLGVRRASVSTAAAHLQRRNLIRYRRGQVNILDRPGLEGAACECYRTITTEYRRLLPEMTVSRA